MCQWLLNYFYGHIQISIDTLKAVNHPVEKKKKGDLPIDATRRKSDKKKNRKDPKVTFGKRKASTRKRSKWKMRRHVKRGERKKNEV